MYYKFNEETLLFEKSKVSNKVLVGAGVIIGLLIVFGFTSNPDDKVKNLSTEDKLIVIREYNEFSEAKLIEKIKQLNFKFPHIILAQSYQETGHYKSGIFLENNNLFGMKQAQIRVTLAKGTNRNHAYYDSWQDSVNDYAMFYATYLSDLKTEGEYFEYLKQNYAEDPTYVQRLRSLIQKRDLKSKFN
jgi:uncharacterized FlgJ-related protein